MKRILFSILTALAIVFGVQESRASSVGGSLDISIPGVGLSISLGDILGYEDYGYSVVPVIPLAVAPPPPPHRMGPPAPRHHMAHPPRRHHRIPAPMRPHGPAFRHHHHR